MAIIARETLDSLTAGLCAGATVLQARLRDLLGQALQMQDFQRLEAWVEAERALLRAVPGIRRTRTAVLGGHTTQPARAALVVAMLAEGALADVYEAPYDTYRAVALDDSSEVYAFAPELILLCTGTDNLRRLPGPGDTAEVAERLASETLAEWEAIWGRLVGRTGATVLQENFVPPAAATAGRLEPRVAWSATAFVERLNRRLWDLDGGFMRVLDVATVSARVGRDRWLDRRWYYHSKHAFSPLFIGEYARLLAGTLRAVLGTTRKCLVLDLDNTLWGGAIGDDGLDNIRLGPGSAEGEAHQAFAAYAKSLAARGVLLAACSKNEESVARKVFDQHLAMPLQFADFAAFTCNWDPKASNLRRIAEEINVGLDRIVFVDDDAVECASVRETLPSVWVVQLPADPADYVAHLDGLRCFDTLAFTAEDADRASSYVAQRALRTAAEFDSFEAFLSNLGMTGSVAEAMDAELPRVEQLFLKTNQFNLTGTRWALKQIRESIENARVRFLVGHLADRFTSYGIVAAIAARQDGAILRVDNWVISCRVFSRTFEDFLLLRLADLARELGCNAVAGEFTPTSKNAYALRWLTSRGLLAEGTGWLLPVDGGAALTTAVGLGVPRLSATS